MVPFVSRPVLPTKVMQHTIVPILSSVLSACSTTLLVVVHSFLLKAIIFQVEGLGYLALLYCSNRPSPASSFLGRSVPSLLF